MAEGCYTLITDIGKAKIANSIPLDKKVNFIKFKVGDGNGHVYEPIESQTDLVNTKWEGTVGSVYIDETNKNWIIVDTVIPANIGGFFIREAGIFDDENNLIAISKISESYKPIFEVDNTTKEMLIRLILEVSNTTSLTLKVDPTVILATKKDIQVIDVKVQAVTAQLSDITQDRIYYCGTTSGTNAYTATNSKITAYTEGLTVRLKIGTASTGASTININGLGAKTILDSLGNVITSGGLKAGLPYQLCYNGTNFIVLGKGGGGNATAAQITKGATATVDSGQVTGTLDLSNLVTANIKSGVTINGVAGSGTVMDTSDAVLDPNFLVTGYSGYDDGVKKNGALPNNIGNWQYATSTFTATNRLHMLMPRGAYDANSGTGVYCDSADFIASNIINGKNIFGLAGTATVASLGGRQFATGTCYASTSTRAYTGNNGDSIYFNYVTISGLSFTPSVIIIKAREQTYTDYGVWTANSIAGNASNQYLLSMFHAGMLQHNPTTWNFSIGANGGNIELPVTVNQTHFFIAYS